MKNFSTSQQEIAKQFLEMVVAGNPRHAFELFVDKDFIHHNMYFKGNAESLLEGMETDAKIHPGKLLEIKNIIQENELVVIHSWLRRKKNDVGFALLHIFRFSNQKIVELWDLAQEIPENSPNEHGMF